MTDAELNAWERQPSVLNILTSKEFGEWLRRRDKNKEKHGEWIDTGSGQECSVCKEVQYGYDNFRNFCPHCGADMKGETNG